MRAIVTLNEKLEERADPGVIGRLHGLLKDLHDLDTGVTKDQEAALLGAISELRARIDQIEAVVRIQRFSPGDQQRRLA